MIPVTLERLAAITGGVLHDAAGRPLPDGDGLDEGATAGCTTGVRGIVVDGPVVTDSREAGPGGLYIARIGEHADGHDYVPGAIAAGAVASLTSRPVPGAPTIVVEDVQEAFAALASAVIDSIDGLVVIGITGSSGKTTTKDLLAGVLAEHGETVANVGSLNSEVGVPLTVCRATPATRYLILEMGARGIGHIRYLTGMTRPSVAVVLNVGSAHVGEFGSREAIATAKAELLEALPPGGLAVLNADDPLVAAMSAPADVRVLRSGVSPAADVRAEDVELGSDGAARFTLRLPGRSGRDAAGVPVTLQLLGRHQVDNALAVAAVATELGMADARIGAALSAAQPASRYRMERHERADGVTVLNDAYNANPESMSGALQTLAHLGRERRTWAVLGGMLELGDDAPRAHRDVGALARELGIDELVAVGELARHIADGAVEGRGADATTSATTSGMTSGSAPAPVGPSHQDDRVGTHVWWVNDTAEAFDLLTSHLRQGDVVLLKSSRDSGLRHLGDRLIPTLIASEVAS